MMSERPPSPLHQAIDRLRTQLFTLKKDLEFQRDGGELFYATDYFELHTYLFRTASKVAVDVGFHPSRPDLAQHQLWLGLAYLFESTSHGRSVYLLPPHAFELAVQLRNKGDLFSKAHASRPAAARMFDQMSRAELSLIQSLHNTRTLSSEQLDRLAMLVKRGFGAICEQASEYLTARQAIERLRDLAKRGRLSTNPEQLLAELALATIEPTSIGRSDTLEILNYINRTSRSDGLKFYDVSKLLDAEAILWLREYNSRLAPINKRMVLVTRDVGVHHAAHTLSSDTAFGWPGVADHIRSADFLMLDLTLQGEADIHDRIAWADRTAHLLNDIESGTAERPSAARAALLELEESGRRLSREAGEIWEEHLNLRLSLAAPKESWLSEGFDLSGSAPRSFAVREIDSRGDRSLMLRDLWRFVSSADFQVRAAKDDAQSLEALVGHGIRILILRVLGPDESPAAIDLFQKRLSNESLVTVLRADAEAMLTTLRFATPDYEQRMRALASVRGDRRQFVARLRKALLDAGIRAAAAGPNGDGELFMALILGMFDLWRPAILLAKRAIEEGTRAHPAEGYYFLATATRRAAIGEARGNIDELAVAYRWIQRAIQLAHPTPEPRFLMERAWIVLQFGNRWRQLRGSANTAPPASGEEFGYLSRYDWEEVRSKTLDDAISDLQEALSLASDSWLRVAILLPLCLACEYSSTERTVSAGEYYDMLQEVLQKDQESERPVFPKDWYQERFVGSILTARRAIRDGNWDLVKICQAQIASIIASGRLDAYEEGILRAAAHELSVSLAI